MKKILSPLIATRGSLTDVLCLCAIVLMPWQARWIVSYQTIGGRSYEYGTIGIYAVSMILVAAIASLHWDGRLKCVPMSFEFKAFMTWLVIGTVISAFPLIGAYYLTLVIIGLLYFILVRSWQRSRVLASVVAAGVLQSVVAWQQFIAQKISPSTLLGVAGHLPAVLGQSVVIINGKRILRAYGLLPHPNILGGMLAVSFALAVYLYARYEDRGRSEHRTSEWSAYIGACLIIFSAILISFSRAALLAVTLFLIGWIAYAQYRHWKGAMVSAATVFVSCSVLFIVFNVIASHIWLQRFGEPSLSDSFAPTQSALEIKSTDERILSYYQAEVMFTPRSFIIGSGLGNYVPRLANAFPSLPVYDYQPVHNAYLLVLLEIGSLGMLFLIWFLRKLFSGTVHRLRNDQNSHYLFSILFIVAFVGLFDHYLWSSMFGLSLVWLTIGIALPADEVS